MFWRCGASIPYLSHAKRSLYRLSYIPVPSKLRASFWTKSMYISFRFVTSCQFLPIISKHHIELSKPQKVLDMRGTNPRTSRMQSERSAICATFPYSSNFELASEQNPWYISFRFVTSCQFLPIISKHQIELSKPQKVCEMRGTDSRTSRMQRERSAISATFPYSSNFELASEQNPWYISFRFVTSCQFFPFVSQNKIELSKPQKCLEMRCIDPRTSRMRSDRSTVWATSPYPSSFELASEQNPWYISFRFVTSCQFLPIISKHQIELSKPQKVCEMRGTDPRTSRMQRERSAISATFPYPSSFELASEQNPWYISFRFVTSCQFLPIISKHQIELSKPQKVCEMRGTDPRTSRMQRERSAISATFPYSSNFELASEQNPWYISFRFVTSCQFFPFVSQNKIELSKPQKCLEMRGIDPRTSRMRRKRSTIWATSPYSSSFELASEQNPWYISFRFVTSCQFFPFVSQNKIELSKPQKCLEMRGIDPRTSRMRRKRSTIWATSPYPSSFELASEQISR